MWTQAVSMLLLLRPWLTLTKSKNYYNYGNYT